MKNTKTNFSKSRFAARVMLLVFLMTSATLLSSCFKRSYIKNVHFKYYSHTEFANFVKQYGEKKQDIFVPTFISFNLDDVEGVEIGLYDVWTANKVTESLITGEEEYEEIYGETHKRSFRCIITFYMDDYSENGEVREKAYEVTCTYITKNYNFYQNDPKHIEFISTSGVSKDAKLYINDIEEVDVKIGSNIETNQEKLDEITKLLMDNIVIINRGGSK